MTTGPRVGDDAIRLRLLVGECRSGAWREGSTGRNPDGEQHPGFGGRQSEWTTHAGDPVRSHVGSPIFGR